MCDSGVKDEERLKFNLWLPVSLVVLELRMRVKLHAGLGVIAVVQWKSDVLELLWGH